MTEKNLQIRLAERPVGLPDDSTFEVAAADLPSAGDGEVLVRSVMLSLDPAMRGWMDDRKSYIPPVALGDVMRGLAVGEVVESRHPKFAEGDRVSGALGWQQWAVMPGEELHALPPGVPYELALGPLGMVGMTAYFGLLDVGEPKEGETVLVSGAAGAVGSLVGQIAKIEGCRAVGIAGGPEKCALLTEELGFDAAIDYKATEDLHADLRAACPRGIDVYFDNVGGKILDTALRSINRGARVVICGAISQYNATEPPPGPANYLSLLVQRARMEGFIVFDYQDRYGEGARQMGQWIQEGKIRSRSHIINGLENAPEALLRLFDGRKTGKLIIRVGPDSP
ncbi:MAG: NADP-dependent oxidoreductase [Acidobacteriota bacterium]